MDDEVEDAPSPLSPTPMVTQQTPAYHPSLNDELLANEDRAMAEEVEEEEEDFTINRSAIYLFLHTSQPNEDESMASAEEEETVAPVVRPESGGLSWGFLTVFSYFVQPAASKRRFSKLDRV